MSIIKLSNQRAKKLFEKFRDLSHKDLMMLQIDCRIFILMLNKIMSHLGLKKLAAKKP